MSRPVLDHLTAMGSLADEMDFHAYLVGGFVRDLLLRIDNFDIDMVIEGDGIRFAKELAKRFGVKDPRSQGVRHGKGPLPGTGSR